MEYTNLTPLKVDGLIYADNIVQVIETPKKMEKLFKIWTEEIERRKIQINVKQRS